eukprot:Hpha_TRINITY_DN14943_c2_g2::TRINITY_DN14943_c2_g2_i1::g.143090::m.143090
MRLWNRCLKWVIKDGDTVSDEHVKRMLIPVAISLLPIAATVGITAIGNDLLLNLIGVSVCGLALVLFLIGVLLNVVKARYLADMFFLLFPIGLVIIDLGAAGLSSRFRPWTYVVLVLDGTLVFGRDRVPHFVIPFTLVYLFADAIESTASFGFYELGNSLNGVEDNRCNCPEPPCAVTPLNAFNNYVSVLAVILIDFYLTRGFSKGMRKQLRSVQSCITVSADVAAALARYDVDLAERAIFDSEEDLPDGLKRSYTQIVTNLRSYKAYLPHSVLVREEADSSQSSTLGMLEDDEEREEPVGSPSQECTIAEALFGCRAPERRERPKPKSPASHEISVRSQPLGLEQGLFQPEDEKHDPVIHSEPDPAPRSLGQADRGGSNRIVNLKAPVRRAKISLAAGNMIGYLSSFGDLAGHGSKMWIAADVERWCASVVSVKGVVDLIAGDRRYASFNARRRCGGHTTAAIEVLASRGDGEWSGCVVTGQVVCGTFGSEKALRFMILGGLASSLHPFERVAAQWRVQLLADGEAYNQACHSWRGLMLGAVFIPKRGHMPMRVYSMTSRRANFDASFGAEDVLRVLQEPAMMDEADGNRPLDKLIDERLDSLRAGSLEMEEEEGVVWVVREVGLRSV